MSEDLKFDLIVSEVKLVEKLDKENLYTITMLGSMRLIPDKPEVGYAEAYAEVAAVKLTVAEIGQRALLKMYGLGDKGDMKEILIRGSPQQRVDSFEVAEEVETDEV